MKFNLCYSVLVILLQVITVQAYEICQRFGQLYTYCNDGQHCCNGGTSCCDNGLSEATIWGIVIGAIILKVGIIVCCVRACKRNRARTVQRHSQGPISTVSYPVGSQSYISPNYGGVAVNAPAYTAKAPAPPPYPGTAPSTAPPAYSEVA